MDEWILKSIKDLEASKITQIYDIKPSIPEILSHDTTAKNSQENDEFLDLIDSSVKKFVTVLSEKVLVDKCLEAPNQEGDLSAFLEKKYILYYDLL